MAECTPAPYCISRAFENGRYQIEIQQMGAGAHGAVQRRQPRNRAGRQNRRRRSMAGMACRWPRSTSTAPANAAVLDEPVVEQRRPELYMELQTTTYQLDTARLLRPLRPSPLPPGGHPRIAGRRSSRRPVTSPPISTESTIAFAARRRQGAEMVVFPKRAITGLDEPAAQTIPGPATERLRPPAPASPHHTLVASLAEAGCGERRYNSAVLVETAGGSRRELPQDSISMREKSNWAGANGE